MSVHVRFNVRMSKVEAEAVDAAVEVLSAACVDFTVARGGKHLAITATGSGHKIMISSTPRTDNHKNWGRQRVQRLVRLTQGQGRTL